MTFPTTPRVRGITATVRADTSDAVTQLSEINRAFAAFREQNDARLAQLEQGRQDAVTVDQVTRLNTQIGELQANLDQLARQSASQQLGGQPSATPEQRDYAAAFNRYFRRGVDAGLGDLAVRASLTSQSDPDGGYAVPAEMDTVIDRVVSRFSVMRQIANVRTISTGTLKKLVNMGGAAGGWAGEEQARTETSSPTMRQLEFSMMEVYAEPHATQNLLDDAIVDIAQWLADEVAITFGELESNAFINGTGANQPFGLLTADKVANASYAWGSLGFVKSGGAAAFAASNPADKFVDLYFALNRAYRANGSWLMNDKTQASVRQFKDGQGMYIWQPPSNVAEVAQIMGKPVYTDDFMPDVAADAYPIAFGDFNRGYQIVDRTGVRVTRDPYTAKPFVKFYTTKRVGGGISNFEAIKLMKIAA